MHAGLYTWFKNRSIVAKRVSSGWIGLLPDAARRGGTKMWTKPSRTSQCSLNGLHSCTVRAGYRMSPFCGLQAVVGHDVLTWQANGVSDYLQLGCL